MIEEIIEDLKAAVEECDSLDEKMDILNDLREAIYEFSPVIDNPVDRVLWVPVEKVRANDYNPNQVADNEMRLLYKSIKEDGFTQPVVCVYDEEADEYEIIDGFHRYRVLKEYEDIYDRSDGLLPITLIDKSINERRASTIRHNRARGKHSITGKSEVVFEMLDDGWSDERICQELGMEKEELIRIKHTTGFSKLFEDTEYNYAWKDTRQLEIEKESDRDDLP